MASSSPVGNTLAVDQVTQVVQSVHSSLAGKSPSTGAFKPQDIFTSVNLPVDARVPLKLKTKIWNNEFIDFGLLLANQFAEGKYQLTLQPGDGSSSSLALEPVTKPNKIVSIDSWVQAFHVFVGVFTSRFPSDGPGLMKYGSTIQDLAARGHNWRFYDENFRFLRQSPSTSLPWGTIHWELWLRSQSPVSVKRAQTTASTGKPMPNLRVPRGFCFTYHRGGDCMGCSFDGSHRGLNCNFRGKGDGMQSQNRGANRPPTHSTTPPPPSPAQQLPTPENIRRMLPFLSGFDHSIVQLLESGFTSGFPLHFDVLKRPLICFRLYRIQRLSVLSFLRNLTPIGLLVLFHPLLSLSFVYRPWVWFPRKLRVSFV